MNEMVMVVDSKWLNKTFGESSKNIIRIEEKKFIKSIASNYKFIERSIAETNYNYKQIISYCLIIWDNEIFMTKRAANITEKRLQNCYSIGIGGHINNSDTKNNNIVIEGMLRELFEEVNIPCSYSYEFYGIINDNSSEVGLVHAGVCFIIKLKEKECSIKENEKLHGLWINKKEINQYMDNFENWSQILINSYIKNIENNMEAQNENN